MGGETSATPGLDDFWPFCECVCRVRALPGHHDPGVTSESAAGQRLLLGPGVGDTGKGEGLWQTLAGACRAPFSLLLLSCKYVDALIPPPSAAPWQD